MKRLALIVVLFAYGGTVSAEALTLECIDVHGGKFVFILDVTEKSAQFVTLETVVTGTLQTDEHHYQLQFPKSEGRWEVHVWIERYSGKFSWEHGEPPFGQLSASNLFRSGKCEKIAYKPKF